MIPVVDIDFKSATLDFLADFLRRDVASLGDNLK